MRISSGKHRVQNNSKIENAHSAYKRARYYHAELGRFISRDPIGYVDGMSLYRAYFVPGGVDPFGDLFEVPEAHHPYACHLGGAYNQPLFYLDGPCHTAAHDYFRGLGCGPHSREPGREIWRSFNPRQQRAHIIRSMRAAGISNCEIRAVIGEIMESARPGISTPALWAKRPHFSWRKSAWNWHRHRDCGRYFS